MKRKIFPHAAVFLAGAVLFSCARTGRESNVQAVTAAAARVGLPESRRSGLDALVFKDFPSESRAYLEKLAAAFGSRNTAFLLAQGESLFEKEVKPLYDDEAYLALLYRSGPYATESPRLTGQTPRLNPENIERILYENWEEAGPLLEINARLISTNGETIPCRIMLVWKLPEPKIQGLFL